SGSLGESFLDFFLSIAEEQKLESSGVGSPANHPNRRECCMATVLAPKAFGVHRAERRRRQRHRREARRVKIAGAIESNALQLLICMIRGQLILSVQTREACLKTDL